ncbi:uncharacterized protein LOC129889933 [Solanum dulcamara]|uniref:uncharacterized protein LOC129889933 n=1 Tax=Solanum dulcamara TaxID=45834 RepID=UPI00248600DE|nr:uncharacterized protein LOC129889933 [Solanum dulcamara]
MANIWAKLKALKKILKTVNKEEFQNISTRITEGRLELIQTQKQINQQCTDELLNKESQALMNIEKWNLVEESALRQKSRAKWIKLGDNNNKYFSAMIKERTNKKMMLELTSLNRISLKTPATIKEEVTQFYKALMGSSSTELQVVDKKTMRRGATITYEQGAELCRDITDKEIWNALASIGDDISPGVDGYNAYFYKKT